MAEPSTYENGFLAGLEYGRLGMISCFIPHSTHYRELRDFIDAWMLAAVAEAAEDAHALRRRILELHAHALDVYASREPRNRPPAELINLTAWRTAEAPHRRWEQPEEPTRRGEIVPLLHLAKSPSPRQPQKAAQPRASARAAECQPA